MALHTSALSLSTLFIRSSISRHVSVRMAISFNSSKNPYPPFLTERIKFFIDTNDLARAGSPARHIAPFTALIFMGALGWKGTGLSKNGLCWPIIPLRSSVLNLLQLCAGFLTSNHSNRFNALPSIHTATASSFSTPGMAFTKKYRSTRNSHPIRSSPSKIEWDSSGVVSGVFFPSNLPNVSFISRMNSLILVMSTFMVAISTFIDTISFSTLSTLPSILVLTILGPHPSDTKMIGPYSISR
ncbi:uncharacterized protein G2W53_041290 [Senna tora]|uniref:Uncharacterized protein n=1 Tax=Senna tora TaxID=362788 RepID=A0A834SEY4_9FABA|nr:uncharacterized protein G2W53_041290 [Senna tora]